MAKLIDITGKALAGEWGTDDETGCGIPVLRTTNFTNEGIVNYNDVVTRTITKKNINDKFLRKGDIIIEKSGGSDKFPVGRVVFFDGEENTYLFNNFTGLLRVKNQDVWYPRYVFYSLLANYKRGGTRAFENKTTGLHNLKTDDYVSRYEIVEADIEEQISICEKLDKLYGIIKSRKKELQLLDDLIKVRFVELFGNGHDGVCSTKMLGDFCKFQQGTQVPVEEQIEEPLDGYTRFLRIIDYTQAPQPPRYVSVKGREIEENSVVIVRYGATAGFVGHGYAGILANNLFEVVPDEGAMSKDFLYLALKYGTFEQEIHDKAFGAAMPALSFGMMNDISVVIPSADTQNEFVNFAAQVDKSKVAVQKSLEETQLLFDSLMQKYFG